MIAVNGSAQPAHNPGQFVHPEDVEPLINAAFAETFCGFVRTLNEQGEWQWIFKDEAPRPLKLLPPVAGSGFQLCDTLDDFCADLTSNGAGWQFLWGVNRKARPDPDAPQVYACVLARTKDDKLEKVGESVSPDPAIAIASAMLTAANYNVEAMHRALFPGRYIAASA